MDMKNATFKVIQKAAIKDFLETHGGESQMKHDDFQELIILEKKMRDSYRNHASK